MSDPFVVGRSSTGVEAVFLPQMANRHGLITGATGTGKTVTIQVLTDHLSTIGVPGAGTAREPRNGLALLDLKDLRAMLQYVGDNAATFRTQYGNVSSASIGAIQRAPLEVEQQGGEKFFGEPMLDVDDLIQTDPSGQGIVNILVADELIRSPKLYATFLLWMLSELYERLPEVGDAEKPKLAFFFDEAHLLFADAPEALVEKIEQVVRLIRSKGVGVYFATQNPSDVPQTVLGQLGNRVQHALRAFTPLDQKAVRVAAQTLRPNPKLDVNSAITELAVGEALVSMLDEKGSPTITERVWIAPPSSRIGPIADAERDAIRQRNAPAYGHYDQAVDRESAYEKLTNRTALKTGAANAPATNAGAAITDTLSALLFGTTGPRGGRHDGLVQSAAKSAARSVGSGVGRAILRGALGSILGGRKS